MADTPTPRGDDRRRTPSPSGTAGQGEGPYPIEEARLVRKAKAGDREALGALLADQESRLFAVCLRMVGERESARDLAQDALVKAIHALETFDERARFSTWITRIAINACVSHLRKRKLRSHPSLDGAAADPADPKLSDRLEQRREPPPHSRVEQSERLEALRLAMGALSPEQRALLLMRDGQDMDYASIAEALNVRVGTVKSRLFRARAALRDAMEQLQSDARAMSQARDDATEIPPAARRSARA